VSVSVGEIDRMSGAYLVQNSEKSGRDKSVVAKAFHQGALECMMSVADYYYSGSDSGRRRYVHSSRLGSCLLLCVENLRTTIVTSFGIGI
jgi:hypothetical protein